MNGLRTALAECAKRIEGLRTRGTHYNEANTKASLVEVVLQALGWDVRDPDEVNREYRYRGSKSNPSDYALFLPERARRPYAVIEAKALGTDLTHHDILRQTLGYATDSGAACAVITDGNEWRIYYTHAKTPAAERLYHGPVRVSATGNQAEETIQIISLLSKEALRDNTLQHLWADDRLKKALHRVFDPTEEKNDKLHGLLAPHLPELTASDLTESLQRLRATFTFESPAHTPRPSIPPQASPPPPPGCTPQKNRTSPSATTQAERDTTLKDLLDAGRLGSGDRLYGFYKGVKLEAEFRADATLFISVLASTYPSVSSAAVAVMHHVNGTTPAQKQLTHRGWNFWRGTDRIVGDDVTLLTIRSRVAASAGSTAKAP